MESWMLDLSFLNLSTSLNLSLLFLNLEVGIDVVFWWNFDLILIDKIRHVELMIDQIFLFALEDDIKLIWTNV